MHATQAAKSSRSDANAFEVRQLDATIVAYHHVLNMALAVDEGSDLPSCFVGQFAKLPCKLRCDDLIGRYAPSVQLFNAPQLIWFQPESVA